MAELEAARNPQSERRDSPLPRRVAVVGTTGSGKSTLASALARHMGVPYVELDALHWAPNWTEVPNELFRERAAEALMGDAWVTDGNYSAVRDIVWSRAEMVIWLDYTLPTILWRLTRRTFRRVVTREELWHGNRESVRTWLFSRDSLYVWALQTYRRRRREYPLLLAKPEHAHLKVLHFRSPSAANAWLRGLDC
jgi:adenylate kinase family enzyme